MKIKDAISYAETAIHAGKTRPEDHAAARPKWSTSIQNRLQDEVLPALLEALAKKP